MLVISILSWLLPQGGTQSSRNPVLGALSLWHVFVALLAELDRESLASLLPSCRVPPAFPGLTRCSARSPRCSLWWPCSTASCHSGKQRGGKSSASSGCTLLPGKEPLSTHWLLHSYLLGYTVAFPHEVLETSVKETHYSAE